MTVLAAIGEERSENPVVSVAYDLAVAHGDDLVVLHVVPTEDFEEYQASMKESVADFDYSFTQEEDSAARFAREVVEVTLGEFDPDVVSPMGRVGDPVDQILSVSEEIDARYLVIGGRRRSPTGKAIFGSATQSILLNASVPVTTVME